MSNLKKKKIYLNNIEENNFNLVLTAKTSSPSKSANLKVINTSFNIDREEKVKYISYNQNSIL